MCVYVAREIHICFVLFVLFCSVLIRTTREFRDVVFEDVGFEHNSWLTLTHTRCGDFTPKADMGKGF